MRDHLWLDIEPNIRVATLRMSRPPVNAFSLDMWKGFGELARQLRLSKTIGAVVFWGGPDAFAAGADVRALESLSATEFRAKNLVLQRAFEDLATLPQITIAAVNGIALGGGLELALAADFRFVADDSRLGLPEVTLGLIPGSGGTQRLQRLAGPSLARDLIYSGRQMDASEALARGLADKVLPREEVYTTSMVAAAGFARGPFALRLAKKAIGRGGELPLVEGLALESELIVDSFASDDARKGLAHFLSKSPGRPRFSQR